MRTAGGAVLTNESLMRTMHPSVEQIELCVDIARELGREVAAAEEARGMYKFGVAYGSDDVTMRELGMPPNRKPGHRGRPIRE